MCGMAISTLMVVELSVVVTAALSIPSNNNIFFVNIIIVKIIIFNMIIMPEQTHAASQEGQHAEKLHRPLEASPQKLSRLHLQEVSPPRLYTPGTGGRSGAEEKEVNLVVLVMARAAIQRDKQTMLIGC